MFEQVIEHHLGISVAFDFNHQPHAAPVRLVADIGNIRDFFIAYQRHNAFNQRSFIHLVRNGGYHNGFAAVFALFNFRRGLYFHAAMAGFKILVNAFGAADNGSRREIGPFDDFHHLFGGNIRVLDIRDNSVAHFAQIMGGNVGGHTHGNTGRTVDEQSRQFGRQYRRFHQRTVVVGNHFNGVFIQIAQHFFGNALQAAFGITHSGGGIAVNGTEVALSVNKRLAQGEILHHAYQRIVNGSVAVRMIFTQHIAYHTGGFFVRFIVFQTHFVHGIQHAAVHGFKAVAHIGQGAPDDYAHRVVNVIRPHFPRNVALLNIAEQVHIGILGLGLVVHFFTHLKISPVTDKLLSGRDPPARKKLNVQVFNFQRVRLDKIAARFHAVAHEHRERLFRVGRIVDFYLD